MTRPPEPRTEPASVATGPRPNRLNQTAAWVGIVAGVIFVAAVLFFLGFFTGGYYDGDHYGYGTYRGGPRPIGPGRMMGPGGPYGPGDMMGPGRMWGPYCPYGPGQQPSTPTTPATPSPPRP